MTVTEPGIREVRIERERNPDGSINKDYKYLRLRIVGDSGSHIVIERVSPAGLVEIAAVLQDYVSRSRDEVSVALRNKL